MKIKDMKEYWWMIAAAMILAILLGVFLPVSFRECMEIVRAFWDTGNRWTRRAIRWMVAYPAILIVVALFGNLTANAVVAIAIPLAAIAMLLRSNFDPLIVGAVAIFKEGQTALNWFMFALGVEAAIGLYLSTIPITTDYSLIPVLLLAVMTLTFFSLSGKKLKTIKIILWIMIIGISAIFRFGGWEGIKEKASAAHYVPPAHPAPYPQDYNKKETRRFEYAEPGGGTMIKLQTNCDREDFIAIIPPHHKITLHHVYFAETVKANRCSFDVYGNSFPVYGPSDAWQTKEEFAGDLPAPQFKAHRSLIKFLYPDMRTVYQGIKRDGDSISADNCSGGEIRIYHVYNISKGILFSGLAQQIGHDGSTVTFEGVITPAECS